MASVTIVVPLSSLPTVPSPGVHQYSFPADQWTQLPGLRLARTNHACTTYSGKVSWVDTAVWIVQILQ